MYFVYREGKYIDVAGESFRDFLEGKLPQLPGEKPNASDFTDHLSTIFPEVRLKSFLEMRGADGGPWSRICALPALWVGLLYDSTALDAAWDLAKDWTIEDHEQLRRDVPKLALSAPAPGGGTVHDLARRVLEIASDGLTRRKRLNSAGDNEGGFLDPLNEIVATGKAPAERLLDLYNGEWQGDLSRIYTEMSF
jgi:glutamate--cysteine ligase